MVAVDHTGQPMLGALKSRKLVQPLGWKTILSQYLIRVVFCSSFDMPSTVMCVYKILIYYRDIGSINLFILCGKEPLLGGSAATLKTMTL